MEAAVVEKGAGMAEWSVGRLDDLNRRFDLLGSRVDTLGGRVDYLSGRVEELSNRVDDDLGRRMDQGFAELRSDISALHRLLIRVSIGGAVGLGIALIGAIAT